MSANASTDAALDTGAKTDLAALRITQRGAKFASYGGGAEGIVVFIHGYLDSPAEWREVIQNLNRPGWEMVAVELRSGGDLRPAATLEAYSRQVRDVLAEVRGRLEIPVVIVGHSMGGQVAELVAEQEHDYLLGLVLIVPAPLRGYPVSDEQLDAFARRARVKDPAAIAKAKTAMAVQLEPKRLGRLVDATLATPTAEAIAALNAWTSGHPRGNDSSRVTAPTLIVVSDDKFFNRQLLKQEVAKRFRDAQLVDVPGTGHWPHVENPKSVAEILDRFISRVSERAPTARRGPQIEKEAILSASIESVSTLRQIDQWFFGEYLPKWVSIGGSTAADPSGILKFWGVPMHAASIHLTKWLDTPKAVLGLLAANHGPLKALGYARTCVLDRRITVYNDDAASIDVIWSRRRADGAEVQRLAVHFEARRSEDGWRVISLASKLTSENSLDQVWRHSRGRLVAQAEAVGRPD